MLITYTDVVFSEIFISSKILFICNDHADLSHTEVPNHQGAPKAAALIFMYGARFAALLTVD